MLFRVQRFIHQHHLMESDGKYLVALSGGADSVALLLILRELHYTIEAVHCNFRLRGEESDRDERFCQSLCEKLQIPLHLVHFDTRSFAELHQVSIEMAARELRYNHFRQLIKDGGFQGVCVAHHRDDSVETVLLNLVRGTGVHGLTGIAPKNNDVIRPLLGVSRQEIEHFLLARSQEFVTDSTNLTADVMRNKIRLEVLPLLKTLNPSVADSIEKTALYMTEAEKVLNDAMRIAFSRIRKNQSPLVLSISALLMEPSPEYLLHEVLSPYGFSSAQIQQIAETLCRQQGRADAANDDVTTSTGKTWLSETHELLIDRDEIIVQSLRKSTFKPLLIHEEGTYILSNGMKLKVERKVVDDTFTISREKTCICLDMKNILFPLKVRLAEEGDRFVPFGMNGSKLVSDFLTDQKKSLFEKREQLVLVQSNNDILWVIGERPDNRYRISSETTDVLMLRVEG